MKVNNGKSKNIDIIFSFPNELYNSYLMIETKTVTPSDTQTMAFKNGAKYLTEIEVSTHNTKL